MLRAVPRPLPTGALLLLMAIQVLGATAGFYVRHADTRLEGDVYVLDARVDLELSGAVLEALESGVPITIRMDMDVSRQRRYLWDENVASLEQRFRLKFHALSQRYVVQNANTGVSRTYTSLEDALRDTGHLRGFPLLDRQLILAGNRYRGTLTVYLDIEALPAPLRPVAYFSRAWRLLGDSYQWQLQ